MPSTTCSRRSACSGEWWPQTVGRPSASRLIADPDAGWLIGGHVVGTVSVMLPEIDGTPPGSETRRMSSCER